MTPELLSDIARRYEIRAFGRLEIIGPDGECALRPAHRRLISILLLAGRHGLDRGALIDRMWPTDPPPSARNALQVHVSAIRRKAPGLVVTTPDGYRLELDGHALDVADFDRHERASREAAAQGDWDRSVTKAASALQLWRGPPFQAIADDEFAVPEVLRLTEQHLELTERRAEGLIALGRAEEAVPELEKLVVAHPLRERMWEHLMVGRYRLGRQAEALRAFREVAELLGRELGIEPGPRLRRLEEEILLQSAAVGDDLGRLPTNLPLPTTSFVGREAAVTEVGDLIASHRLVTITGAPGVGKSRLAVEIGRSSLDRHPGGVWLVDLTGADSASDVSSEIASTLGAAANVADLHDLGEVLADVDALVILDECAHVRDGVRRFVAGLDDNDAVLRVLATSRRHMGVQGEAIYELPALELPAHGDTERALASSAVRLLVDRIRAHAPRFQLADDSATALVELSRWSDGIPLALELAAHWVGQEGFEPDPRRGLGEPLLAALDASYEFMAASDRQVLLAASTFAGPVPIDAVAGVCTPTATSRELSGVMSRLVESSMMRVDIDDAGRSKYTMLHPVREYCRNRLSPTERTMLAATHARWFASQFRELAAMAHVQVGSLMADIRAAVRTLIAGGDLSDAADLVVAVRAYWDATYLTWEASEWLETIIALLDPADVAIETLVAAGWAAYLHHDYALARDRYRTALDVAREKGDARFEGVALFGLGRIEAPISPPTAESLLDEALERFRSAHAVRDEAACLLALGVGLAWRGAAARARDHLVRCLDTIGDDGDPEVRSVCHRYLSLCAWYEGDAAAAAEHARRAETIARDADDDRRLSGALLQRALVAVGSGDLPDAAAAALEAFAPIPAYASIDLALVSFGAVPVLVACDEHALAGEVFAMIDEVFAAHGWMRIDQRSPLAAELRARVEEPSGPRSAPELRTELTATLARFSRR